MKLETRVTRILLVGLVLMALAGCGETSDEPNIERLPTFTPEALAPTEAPPTDTPEPVAPEPTATLEPPTATPQPTVAPVPATDTPAPEPPPAEPTATPAPAEAPTQAGGCECASDTYNCGDFETHAAAQACFDYCQSQGVGDIHKLDGNDADGLACESLP